jgi:hypothetical protein
VCFVGGENILLKYFKEALPSKVLNQMQIRAEDGINTVYVRVAPTLAVCVLCGSAML